MFARLLFSSGDRRPSRCCGFRIPRARSRGTEQAHVGRAFFSRGPSSAGRHLFFSKQGGVMNRSLILAAALSCVMGSASMAQNSATSAQSSASVQEFVQRAGASGLAEVEMGELGAKKAKNGQVEAFAKRMVADHTKANQELLTAIKGKGVQVPSSRTDTHKAMVEKFQQQDAGKN